MNKKLTPLEALKELQKRYGSKFSVQDEQRYRIIEKSLKALEIMKEKGVNTYILLLSINVEDYNRLINFEWRKLTQEEYDLLKEVLL